MRKNLLRPLVFATFALVLFLGTTFILAAGEEQVPKPSKKQEIRLFSESKVWDVTLKPGTYTIQHRVEGSDHFMRFTGPAPKLDTKDVHCKAEALKSKADQTAVFASTEGEAVRVTRIVIKGESVAHVF
jgi:hypothetical protein